jgi:hypothetical protein
MVVPMLLLAVPLIIFNQCIILGSVSFLLGFKPKEALTIGSCLAGRGEDTLLYATIGANLETVGSTPREIKYYLSETSRNTLFTFAGIFCFIMATMVPIIVKNISKIVKVLKSVTPHKWAFGATIVHKSLKSRIFSVGGPFIKEEKRLLFIFGAYAGVLFGVILIRELFFFILFVIAGAIVIYFLKGAMDAYLAPTIDMDLYRDMHLLIKDEKGIHDFVIGTLVTIISAPFIVSTLWGIAQIFQMHTPYYPWWIAVAGALLIIGSIAMGNERIYDETMERPRSLRKEHMMRKLSTAFHLDGDYEKNRTPGYRPIRDRSKTKFRPMRYDELIPTKLPKDKNRTSGRRARGPSRSRRRFRL